jgi:hypothetical protein
MMTSKLIGYSVISDAWNTKASSKSTNSTKTEATAIPRSTTNASTAVASASATPNYGSKHDQTIGIEVYKNLASVPNLNSAQLKSATGGLPAESLQDAYNKLMAINSTANLSPDQKALLEAFTNAWISQHPEDGIKQGETIANARKVATIFKAQIIDNYVLANTGTLNKTNALGGFAWPEPARFKTFFEEKPTTEELGKRAQAIGNPTKPIAASGLNPTANVGYTQIQRTI